MLQSTVRAKAMTNGYRYLYGGKGQAYTTALVNKLAKAYPSTYTASLKKEALKDADKGYIAIDCSYFVCTALGIAQTNSTGIKNKAVKLMKVSKANAKEGMALWFSGHIAYVGDDLKIYEARSTAKDITVSSWDSRAKDFTYMFVVKGSELEKAPATTVTKKITYYPKYNGSTTSIVAALKTVGEKDTSITNRKKIASLNGIANYSGTATQNTTLLKLLKSGKLVRQLS